MILLGSILASAGFGFCYTKEAWLKLLQEGMFPIYNQCSLVYNLFYWLTTIFDYCSLYSGEHGGISDLEFKKEEMEKYHNELF